MKRRAMSILRRMRGQLTPGVRWPPAPQADGAGPRKLPLARRFFITTPCAHSAGMDLRRGPSTLAQCGPQPSSRNGETGPRRGNPQAVASSWCLLTPPHFQVRPPPRWARTVGQEAIERTIAAYAGLAPRAQVHDVGERGFPALLFESAEGYAKLDSPVAYSAEVVGNN